MTEKRFIELVNLYIDDEISAAELEELETEVAQNLERRLVYHQYCRLQQVSHSVCAEYGGQLARTVDFAKYDIVARGASRRWQQGFLYSAGALAAACLSVLATIHIFDGAVGFERDFASPQSSPPMVVEVFEPRYLEARMGRNGDGAVRFASQSSASRRSDFMESVRTSARTGFQLSLNPAAWDEEFRTGTPPTRVFRSHSSFETTELVSFQFQR